MSANATQADEPIAEYKTATERWELFNRGRPHEVEIIHYVDDREGEEHEDRRYRMSIASVFQCIYNDRHR